MQNEANQDGSKRTCDVYWLGTVEYEAAWKLQNRLAYEIAAGTRKPVLLLLEHPHVYTLGRRGHDVHLLWDEEERAKRGIAVHWVDRGGDITYHGPGQLVGYPLLSLGRLSGMAEGQPAVDFVGYVRNLEKLLIFTLAEYGIPSGQRSGLTGVWVPADVRARCLRCDPSDVPDPAKIASIGIKIDARGITRHGFALNVQPEMTYWEGIVPCGIQGVTMTSIEELISNPPTVRQAADRLAKFFSDVFDYTLVWHDQLEEGWLSTEEKERTFLSGT